MKNCNRLLCLILSLFGLSACQTQTQSLSTPDFSRAYEITEHPLIGKIWSPVEQRYIETETLKAQVLKRDAVLLGETHDNARHHQLQALFIQHLIKHQHEPIVAFEMLNRGQQDNIDQFQTSHNSVRGKTDSFAEVVQWQKSGWPQWPYYRPVFQPVIENDRPIVAANLDRASIRKVIKQGSSVLEKNYQNLLSKYQYDSALKNKLEQEILSAHCDMLPESMLAPMLMGQQVRDLSMTLAMLGAVIDKQTNETVVLIAGSGHTRTDYGVPYYLQQEAPELKRISIAFIEVRNDKFHPRDYTSAWSTQTLPFDYVWFTPQAQREDQCEKMKAHMKSKS